MTDLEEIVRDYLAQCGLRLDEAAILSADARDVHLGSIEVKGDPVLMHLSVTVQIKPAAMKDAMGKWQRERVKRPL